MNASNERRRNIVAGLTLEGVPVNQAGNKEI
jgi:hypothetical protein